MKRLNRRERDKAEERRLERRCMEERFRDAAAEVSASRRKQEEFSRPRPGRFIGDTTATQAQWDRGFPDFVPATSYTYVLNQWREMKEERDRMQAEAHDERAQRRNAEDLMKIEKARADHQLQIIESLESDVRSLKAQLEGANGRKRTWRGIFPRRFKFH